MTWTTDSNVESVLAAFETAWRRGQAPRPEDFLPSDGPASVTLLLELVHADLEWRIRSGQAVAVEEYADRFPALAADAQAMAALAIRAAELRERFGPRGFFCTRVRLEVVAGPHQGETFTFNEHDTFLVGRSKKAHFRLPERDEYFSRLHFLVEVNPPRAAGGGVKSGL